MTLVRELPDMEKIFSLQKEIYKTSCEKGVFKKAVEQETFNHLHCEIDEAAFNSGMENMKEEIADIAIILLSFSEYKHISLDKICKMMIASDYSDFNKACLEYCIDHFESFKVSSYLSEKFLEMHKLASTMWDCFRKGKHNVLFVTIARTLIFIIGFCYDYGINLYDEVVKKHEKFKKRTYENFYAA